MTYAELLKHDGARVECEINGKKITDAVLSIEEGGIYICQNNVDGTGCKNKHGYAYSFWAQCSRDVLESIRLVDSGESWTHEKLLKLDGQSVECDINGTHISDGKIMVENERVFICQNKKEGARCSDALGYSYSWFISSPASKYEECDQECENITLKTAKTAESVKAEKPTITTVKEINEHPIGTVFYHEGDFLQVMRGTGGTANDCVQCVFGRLNCWNGLLRTCSRMQRNDEKNIFYKKIDPIGMRVKRGPDWRWGDQDGNGYGTVINMKAVPGWLNVKWDKGYTEFYEVNQNKIDIVPVDPDDLYGKKKFPEPDFVKLQNCGCSSVQSRTCSHRNQESTGTLIFCKACLLVLGRLGQEIDDCKHTVFSIDALGERVCLDCDKKLETVKVYADAGKAGKREIDTVQLIGGDFVDTLANGPAAPRSVWDIALDILSDM